MVLQFTTVTDHGQTDRKAKEAGALDKQSILKTLQVVKFAQTVWPICLETSKIKAKTLEERNDLDLLFF